MLKTKEQTSLKNKIQQMIHHHLTKLARDKGAKTKPSIHTKKFKQMYGEMMNEKGLCWSGYKQVGMKTKNGKQVPNCVPESMSIEDAKKVDGYVPESYEIVLITLITQKK